MASARQVALSTKVPKELVLYYPEDFQIGVVKSTDIVRGSDDPWPPQINQEVTVLWANEECQGKIIFMNCKSLKFILIFVKLIVFWLSFSRISNAHFNALM